MTVTEFSNEFDVLYNNIMSNQAPGLDEYEKSVFLTKAQTEILNNYSSEKGNKYQEGIDGSMKRQIDFSSLMVTKEPPVYTNVSYVKIDDRSKLYEFPNDVFRPISETIIVTSNGVNRLVNILPINFNEYNRLMTKPYKLPLKNQAWRMIQAFQTNIIAEIVAKPSDIITKYKVRYIRKPKPIVLVNLGDIHSDVSIEGVTTIQECELDPLLHPEILQRAVELAKGAYEGDIKTTVDLGQRSE